MPRPITIDARAITGIALFESVPNDVVKAAASMASVRHRPVSTRIFDQGEHAGRAHALISGCVRITQSGSDGEEILVRFIGPGEIFGCVPMLTDGIYPADATATTDSVEVAWDSADLLALMRLHSQIALNMVAIVGRRVSEAQKRIRELATQSAERRIAHTLLRLLDQAGSETREGIRICFPLRRKDIADIAGATLHTVSRILASWERRGYLISQSQRLVIMLPDSIRRIAIGEI